jgi:hypothetical protein
LYSLGSVPGKQSLEKPPVIRTREANKGEFILDDIKLVSFQVLRNQLRLQGLLTSPSPQTLSTWDPGFLKAKFWFLFALKGSAKAHSERSEEDSRIIIWRVKSMGFVLLELS